jgi:hypothetical protein
MTNSLIIEPIGQGTGLDPAGDEQTIAVEAFAGEEMIGGIQFEFEPPEPKHIHLPVILKKLSRT